MHSSVPMFSVIIPYFDRLPYIERALFALADQDFPRGNFEIVIGCLEYSEALLKILSTLPDDLQVRCVMDRTSWNVGRARNMALQHAKGEVLILLDCDMLLPAAFLRTLGDWYRSHHRNQLLIAQMLDYDAYTDVPHVTLYDYSFYKLRYLSRNDSGGSRGDLRWTISRPIPWALCWTAIVIIPRELVERHSLYFDPEFRGWGAEDLEWGFRVSRAGIPIAFADELWGIHLPHARSGALNASQERSNLARFLRKWPCFDVELVCAFGPVVANQRYDELMEELRSCCPEGRRLGVVEFSDGGATHLAIGATFESGDFDLICERSSYFDPAAVSRYHALWGLRLPYDSGTVRSCVILPSIYKLPAEIQNLIRAEARRVAREELLTAEYPGAMSSPAHKVEVARPESV